MSIPRPTDTTCPLHFWPHSRLTLSSRESDAVPPSAAPPLDLHTYWKTIHNDPATGSARTSSSSLIESDCMESNGNMLANIFVSILPRTEIFMSTKSHFSTSAIIINGSDTRRNKLGNEEDVAMSGWVRVESELESKFNQLGFEDVWIIAWTNLTQIFIVKQQFQCHNKNLTVNFFNLTLLLASWSYGYSDQISVYV